MYVQHKIFVTQYSEIQNSDFGDADHIDNIYGSRNYKIFY